MMDCYTQSQTGNLPQRGFDSPVLPSDGPAPPPLGRKAWGGDLSFPFEQGLRDTRYWGLGKPKHEVGRPRFGPLFRDSMSKFALC